VRRQTILLTVCCFTMLAGCSTTRPQAGKCDTGEAAKVCSTTRTGVEALRRSATNDVPMPPSAISDVIRNAAVVRASEARIAAADADIGKARAMYMPTASFDASGTLRASDRHPAFANDPNNPYSYALTVRVPIYQGGRAESAVTVAEASKRVAIENARDVSLSTTYELALALVDTERFRATLAILSRHEKRLRALQRDVKGEREAGGATGVDVSDVERQLASLAVNRQQTALQLAQSEETLLRLDAGHGLKMTAVSNLSARLPSDENALLQLALDHNPRLSERAARIDVAEARIQQAKSAYNPNLALDLSAGGDGHANSYNRQYEASAVLKLSVPLFTGGARSAEIQGSREELLATTLDRDAALSGVRAALLTARARLDQARQMLAAARREQGAANRLLDGIRSERKLGERSVFDEIRTIGDVANAELNMNTAHANVLAAEVTLAAETGMLADFLGIAQPSGAEEVASLK